MGAFRKYLNYCNIFQISTKIPDKSANPAALLIRLLCPTSGK
jgi:hypothetical protein